MGRPLCIMGTLGAVSALGVCSSPKPKVQRRFDVRLYHGSKTGIEGSIAPISRSTCDFGRGFYMYADPDQPRALVCAFPTAHVYTLEADFSGLRTLDMGLGLDWAMLIAFNRGKMEGARDSALYRRCRETMSSCDVVSGLIANDRMFVVLDRFFSGEITDVALIRSLSALKLGGQYVCLTPEACERVRIVNDEVMAPEERERLSDLSVRMRREGIARRRDLPPVPARRPLLRRDSRREDS